jgi:hypothetical protein
MDIKVNTVNMDKRGNYSGGVIADITSVPRDVMRYLWEALEGAFPDAEVISPGAFVGKSEMLRVQWVKRAKYKKDAADPPARLSAMSITSRILVSSEPYLIVSSPNILVQ